MKTALLYAVRDLAADELERRRADLAASYQRAIVRALVEPHARGGGRSSGTTGSPSSAASRRTPSSAPRSPRPCSRRSQLCTDNAAMIASAARFVDTARAACATSTSTRMRLRSLAPAALLLAGAVVAAAVVASGGHASKRRPAGDSGRELAGARRRPRAPRSRSASA